MTKFYKILLHQYELSYANIDSFLAERQLLLNPYRGHWYYDDDDDDEY